MSVIPTYPCGVHTICILVCVSVCLTQSTVEMFKVIPWVK